VSAVIVVLVRDPLQRQVKPLVEPAIVWRRGVDRWEAGDAQACAPHRTRGCRECRTDDGAQVRGTSRAFAIDLRTLRAGVAA
jgi:hypothetical protein